MCMYLKKWVFWLQWAVVWQVCLNIVSLGPFYGLWEPLLWKHESCYELNISNSHSPSKYLFNYVWMYVYMHAWMNNDCVSLCMPCMYKVPVEARRQGFLRIWVKGCCEPPNEFWDSNLSPPQEQQALLIAEPSLQPLLFLSYLVDRSQVVKFPKNFCEIKI